MVLPRGMGDLYHRYRPRKFDEIVGQKSIISSLRKIPSLEVPPSAVMFSGPSGTGKTTCARILAMSLNCSNLDNKNNPCTSCPSCKSIMAGKNPDIKELNAADNRGIDDIRRIKEDMCYSSFSSTNKIYILDEAHSLTKDAQNSLLKVLEEAPKGSVVILCSTEPNKFLKTVINRCQHFSLTLVADKDVSKLISTILELEGESIDTDLVKKVVKYCAGSPRAALVGLQQILQSEGGFKVEDLDSCLLYEEKDESFMTICRGFFNASGWGVFSNALKTTTVAPEAMRIGILSYCKSVLLSDSRNTSLAFQIMAPFMIPFASAKPENELAYKLYQAFLNKIKHKQDW